MAKMKRSPHTNFSDVMFVVAICFGVHIVLHCGTVGRVEDYFLTQCGLPGSSKKIKNKSLREREIEGGGIGMENPIKKTLFL